MTNYWEEICDELYSEHPRIAMLRFIEDLRNAKIDAEGLGFRKTNYFRGLSGFFLSIKFRKEYR